jgi:hypothetical protein
VTGLIEENVRLNIATLATAHPMRDALAEVAYRLARSLDLGAGLLEAATSKELRAVLADLASVPANDDDDDLSAHLSAPVRDTQD